MTDVRRWRGLKNVLQDVVEHGTRAVERVHLATANRSWSLLQLVPGIGAAARVAHAVHDAAVSSTYTAIRAVNAVAGAALDVTLDVVAARDPPDRDAPQHDDGGDRHRSRR